jgi:8-amino-7-oxononanoate synthase
LSIKAAYEYIESHYEKLKSFLESNIIYFKELSIKNNLPLGNNNNTAIQTVIIPDNSKVREVADFLQKNGFDVRPIISPTVPEGSERLRIIIHSFNTLEQIENLIKLLKLKV